MPSKRINWERLLPNMVNDDEGIPSMPGGPILYRCKVRGGWIVATGKGEGAGVTFVPDDDHRWVLQRKNK